MNELKFVEDWFQLAHPFLGSDRARAAVVGIPVQDRPKYVIDAWLGYFDIPSWDEVANVIENCFPGHEDVAEQFREKYLPKVEFIGPNEQQNMCKSTYNNFIVVIKSISIGQVLIARVFLL